MNRRDLVLVVGLIGVLGLACAKPAAPQALETASFPYTPTVTSGGQGISLALINPHASDRLVMAIATSGRPELAVGVATRGALDRSLLEYFTTAGFTVGGPFKSIDEMTFPEKKQADLILTVEFDILPTAPAAQMHAGLRDSGIQITANKFSADGNCTLAGNVSFVMWEPLSRQRMWAKSAEVSELSEDCSVKLPGVQAAEFDAMRANTLVRLYERGFAGTMKTAERYFNPEEVALVKAQSAELRDKKVY